MTQERRASDAAGYSWRKWEPLSAVGGRDQSSYPPPNDDYVNWLRGIGASDELVEFVDSTVPRYSQRERDSSFRSGFRYGMAFAIALLLFVGGCALFVVGGAS